MNQAAPSQLFQSTTTVLHSWTDLITQISRNGYFFLLNGVAQVPYSLSGSNCYH